MLQTFDFVWMGALASANRLAIPEPPIIVRRTVLELDDEFDPSDFTPSQRRTMEKLGYTAVQ